MTINDLPAIMGTVLIVAGLALVGIYTRFRTEGSDRSVQAGALLIVVGAVLLDWRYSYPAQNRTRASPIQIRTLPSLYFGLRVTSSRSLKCMRY